MATSNKYDRQLRLWGAAGQQALAETVVVLLNPTAAGTETLKNLVLPGLGKFVVVDQAAATVSAVDAASNFFLPSVGSPRAATAATCLQELNPDVYGAYSTITSWNQATANQQAFEASCLQHAAATSVATAAAPAVTRQILVLASDLEPLVLERVAAYCAALHTALIVVQGYGLTGTVRNQFATSAFPIVDPKPRARKPDLRLRQPFPALQAYLANFDLTNMAASDFAHVPYPVLLWQAAQAFRSTHNGNLPQTFAQKQEFVKVLTQTAPWLVTATWQSLVGSDVCTQFALEPTRAMTFLKSKATELQQQVEKAGVTAELIEEVQKAARQYPDELNVQEAVENAYLAYAEESVPDVQALRGNTDVPPYWPALLQALEKFQQENNGRLPVHGSIPDMTASTANYLKLQQVYHDQAAADLAVMQQFVAGAAAVSADLVTTFCQNIPYLDLMERRTLTLEVEEATVPDEIREEIAMALWEVDAEGDEDALDLARTMIPAVWYWGIRACQIFHKEQGRYPGVFASNEQESEKALAQDAAAVQTHWMTLAASYGWTTDAWPGLATAAANVAAEMTRYGAAEIHNVAAVVGGVASQEAVKLLTQQYTPLQHTYVYNGIASTAAVYRF